MRTSEENIRQLLEMLDNPDVYTEQEIQDIINRDEETRETYRLMVEAKRCSRHRQHQKPVDVDAAWQRLRKRRQPKQQDLGWMKIAASFIGILLVSSIAFAAIHIVRQNQKKETPQVADTTAVANTSHFTSHPLSEDSTIVQPIIYDNVPLEKMLPEIAAHYDVEVTFANEAVRGFRFRFVWNPQQGIDQVISDLNQFERLTVTSKDNQITVK